MSFIKLSREKLIFIVLLTIFVKLIYILVPTYSMGSPRKSDDSLIYLWAGKMNFYHFDYKFNSVNNVKKMYADVGESDQKQHHLNYRILGKVKGSFSPLYEFITGASFLFDIQMKWIYALIEIFVLLVFQISFLLLCLQLTNNYLAIAATSLLTSTFVYQFVPSILCLSFGMLLIERILNKNAGKISTSFITFLTIISHPMGIIYFCIAGTLALFFRREKFLFLVLASSLLLGKIFPTFLYWTEAIPHKKLGGFTLDLSNIALQAKSLYIYLYNLVFVTFPSLIIFFVAFVFCMFQQGKYNLKQLLQNKIFILCMILLGLLQLSIFHYLPTKPIEVFKRIFFFGFHIFVLAVLSNVLDTFEKSKFRRYFVLSFCSLIFANFIYNVPVFKKRILEHINDRYYVIDEEKLRESINRLTNEKIVSLDAENAFMYYILLGGHNHDIYNYDMIKNNPLLLDDYDLLEKNNVFVMPTPKVINTLAYNENNNLIYKRHNGISFKFSDQINIENLKEKSIELGFLNRINLKNIEITNGKCSKNLKIEKIQDNLISINSICLEYDLKIIPSNDDNWITQIKLNKEQKTNWPWGTERLEIAIESRNGKAKRMFIKFGLKSLFDTQLLKKIQKNFELDFFSDNSGLLFFRLI